MYKNEIGKYLKRVGTVVEGSSVVEGSNAGANVFVVSSLRGKKGIDECIVSLETCGIPLDKIEVSMPEPGGVGQGSIVVISSEHLERMIQNVTRK